MNKTPSPDSHTNSYESGEGVFSSETRVHYPAEIKWKAIEMRQTRSLWRH